MYTLTPGVIRYRRKKKKYNNKQKENAARLEYIYDFSFNFSHVVAPKAFAKWSSTTDSIIDGVLGSFVDVVNGQNLPSDRAKCSSIESTRTKKIDCFFANFHFLIPPGVRSVGELFDDESSGVKNPPVHLS